jgi:hypothetical protein
MHSVESKKQYMVSVISMFRSIASGIFWHSSECRFPRTRVTDFTEIPEAKVLRFGTTVWCTDFHAL